MAKQPDDMVIRLLQQIQATLADHGRMHDEHRHAFERIERRLQDIQESTVTALGLSAQAHIRHETVQQQLDELRHRVEQLESQH